jgi:hypothetical protein
VIALEDSTKSELNPFKFVLLQFWREKFDDKHPPTSTESQAQIFQLVCNQSYIDFVKTLSDEKYIGALNK